MIYKHVVYKQETDDGEEQMVTVKEPIDGGDDLFFGHAMIGIRVQTGATFEHPVLFPIPEAKTIQEAYEKFETSRDEECPKQAKSIIEDMQKQMETDQSKLIVPQDMAPNIPFPPNMVD